MTTSYDLTETYITISECGSDADENFILDVISGDGIFLKFGTGDGFHHYRAGETAIRAGVAGAVTVRAANVSSKIVVSGV